MARSKLNPVCPEARIPPPTRTNSSSPRQAQVAGGFASGVSDNAIDIPAPAASVTLAAIAAHTIDIAVAPEAIDLPPDPLVQIGSMRADMLTAETGGNLVFGLGGNDTFHIDSHNASATGIFLGGDGDDTFYVEVTGDPVDHATAPILLYGGAGEDTFDIYFEVPESSRVAGILPAAPIIMDFEAGDSISLHTFFVYYDPAAYIGAYEFGYDEALDMTFVVGGPEPSYYGPPGPDTPEPAVLLGIAGQWMPDELNIDIYVEFGI